MSLRPRTLPTVRAQTLRHVEDPTKPVRSGTSAALQEDLDRVASHLRAADLYWVASDMAALAMSAGAQLASARWGVADRPSPCGLVVFDGGIGSVDAGRVGIPVHAITWGPTTGGCQVSLFMSRWALNARIVELGEYAPPSSEDVPPLVPITGFAVPVTDDPLSMAELPQGAPASVFAALAASWYLMRQPQLIDRTRERPDKATRRALVRGGLPDPEVTVVDLRRQYVPDDHDPDPTSGGRMYRHRWVVSGHWREYKADRYSAELRQSPQWIPAYVKGPAGAPLLATERVNVWRR